MTKSTLEHANITVSDPQATAAWLGRVFGWHTRWQGEAKDNGYTVHVGTDNAYLAVYAARVTRKPASGARTAPGGLNHVGIVVDDLDETEKRVIAEGFKPMNHADYEPGRRFYFDDHDGIEFEVVSYG
ncbi:MAG: VOC family protein [Nitratireductor sp.]|nr:VOC family protein [Nitratireductor sp.]